MANLTMHYNPTAHIAGNNNNGGNILTVTTGGNQAFYTVLSVLGRGAFGTVEKCNVERQVALKKVAIDTDKIKSNANLLKVCEDEAKILMTLSHPNIVKIYNAWSDENNSTIFMELEYCGGGTLSYWISDRRKEGTKFEESEIKSWLAQIAIGIAYLHDLGIIHRDLKSENILMTTDMQTPKIVDLGLAKISERISTIPSALVGTVTYMAPEAIFVDKDLKSQPKVDVWAFGVIAFQMATLELPYMPRSQDMNLIYAEFYKLFQNKNWKPEKINMVDWLPDLRHLIENLLLVMDSRRRADMAKVLSHEFFALVVKHFQAELNNCVHERIEHFTAECSRKDSEIEQLNEQVQNLRVDIRRLNQEIGDKDEQIKQLEIALQQAQQQQAATSADNSNDGEVLTVVINVEAQKDFFAAVSRGDVTGLAKGQKNAFAVDAKYVKGKYGKADGSDEWNGKTALMIAALKGHADVVRALLTQFNAKSLNQQDDEGMTALMLAIMHGNNEVVELLVKDFHANMEKREYSYGKTALMIAANWGNYSIAELLLKSGANAATLDKEQRPATAWAYRDDIKSLLSSYERQ